MGYQEIKHQVEVSSAQEAEGRIWMIAGISLRAPLKPIKTRKISGRDSSEEVEDIKLDIETMKTPTEREARIPEEQHCPPAPKKMKPSLRCCLDGIQFFSVPDLESMFIPHQETELRT